MGKISFLVGFAAGYVFGAKAGEKRYEQIKLHAGKAWQHPAVQEKVEAATEQVKERGPEIAAAAGSAALKGASNAAKGAVSAGYQAAVGANKGPVVQGSVESSSEQTAPSADTDSGSTKVSADVDDLALEPTSEQPATDD